MDFYQAELRYLEWKRQFDSGQIDGDTFEERVNTLIISAPDDTSWHLGINTGLWYRLEGGVWVEDNPHKKYGQPAVSVEPPPPPRESFRQTAASQVPTPRPSRKSSTLTVILVVLGVLICFGFLAGGVLFAGLLPKLISTPTLQASRSNPSPTPAPAATTPPAPPATGTPPQQPTEAAPSPSETMLFEDDFSDETSGWQDIRVGENFDTLYFEGGYLIVVTTKGYHAQADPGRDFSGAVRVEVDAVQNTGSPYDEYGLMCHYVKNSDGTGSYYYFSISNDGLGLIYKVDHDRKSLLLVEPPGKHADVILAGKQVNHLRADCLADGSLALTVNGVELASASDNSFTGGGAGLRADSEAGETEIRFDDFTVYQP